MDSETHVNTPETSNKTWIRRHPIWTGIIVIVGIFALLIVLSFIVPFSVDDTSIAQPAGSHEEAIQRVAAIRESEEAKGDLNPVCLSNVITHGEKTDKVIVFYHGFTSCPEQFRELGESFFEQGYNIFIPRLPHHGNSDQLADDLIGTSAEELAGFATETIDIAHGLGDEVIVAGLSGGGTIAAWIAQEHEDVDTAVLVAPFLGIGFIPAFLNQPVTRIADDIPNIWMWWDPERKADNPFTAPYSYPRYPLHALAEYLRLGFAAKADATQNAPGVKNLYVVTNAHDTSVSNAIIQQFVDQWQTHYDEKLTTYQFPADLNLPHDVITPTREDGQPALVYPIITELIQSAGNE